MPKIGQTDRRGFGCLEPGRQIFDSGLATFVGLGANADFWGCETWRPPYASIQTQKFVRFAEMNSDDRSHHVRAQIQILFSLDKHLDATFIHRYTLSIREICNSLSPSENGEQTSLTRHCDTSLGTYYVNGSCELPKWCLRARSGMRSRTYRHQDVSAVLRYDGLNWLCLVKGESKRTTECRVHTRSRTVPGVDIVRRQRKYIARNEMLGSIEHDPSGVQGCAYVAHWWDIPGPRYFETRQRAACEGSVVSAQPKRNGGGEGDVPAVSKANSFAGDNRSMKYVRKSANSKGNVQLPEACESDAEWIFGPPENEASEENKGRDQRRNNDRHQCTMSARHACASRKGEHLPKLLPPRLPPRFEGVEIVLWAYFVGLLRKDISSTTGRCEVRTARRADFNLLKANDA
ncbi:hypothetical protein DFP72DRAFT_852035 [Ephemerocybe angulata]|uniref:Uncharacterized protein n=1 Tax=Ephemerocybe angulata TaxID=980116 RepID=A0A8H6LZP9_9AGAR|nr:hypothetical protein DFP72DRAFT_852035 [Tulosesus angulatus]